MSVYSNLKYQFPTSAITSGTFADARIAASNVNQHATTFDDNKIVNDISTLGLRVHTQENLAGSNTNSASFDVFQDATKITSLTGCSRDSGEFLHSTVDSSVQTIGMPLGTWKSNNDYSISTGGHSGSITNDFLRQSGSGNAYTSCYVDYLFDLANDFNIKIYYVDGNKDRSVSLQFPAYGFYIIANENLTAGLNPASFANLDTSVADYGQGNNAWTSIFTDSAASSLGTNTSVVQIGNNTGSAHTFASDTNYYGTAYHNGSQGSGSYGIAVEYDASASQMIIGMMSNQDLTNFKSNAKFVLNNVPDTGRFAFNFGEASGTNTTGGFCTTYNGIGTLTTSNSCHGTAGGSTVNAAGSFQGTAITAASSTNKMGAVITYQDHAGTNTLNTDVVLQLSADNGSNFSTATLTALPDFSTGIKMAKVNDLSVTAGTQLKYKLSFANQASGSKEARIRGVSLQY